MVVDQKKKNAKNVKGYEFLNKVEEGWLSGLKHWFAKPKQGITSLSGVQIPFFLF